MRVEKEVNGDYATAYAYANFVASKPAGSGNLAGYGFHNRNLNGAFLYYGDEGRLHLLRNNGTNEIIPFKSELEKINIGGQLRITWAQDISTGELYLRFFIGDIEVAAIRQGAVLR